MKPDWKKIKSEYLRGDSREDICSKWKINYKTLNSRIDRGKWSVSRENIKVKTQEKLVETVSQTLAERQARCLALQEEVGLEQINLARSRLALAENSTDLKNYSDVIKRGFENYRQALGIKDEIGVTSSGKVEIVLPPDLRECLIE